MLEVGITAVLDILCHENGKLGTVDPQGFIATLPSKSL
jgi:hypothetical protein